jgi:hypothetical protein
VEVMEVVEEVEVVEVEVVEVMKVMVGASERSRSRTAGTGPRSRRTRHRGMSRQTSRTWTCSTRGSLRDRSTRTSSPEGMATESGHRP